MDILKIAAPGLPSQDRLVLSSALNLLSRDGCDWRLVEDESEAVLVMRRLAPMPADARATTHALTSERQQSVRLHLNRPDVDMPLASPMMLPLRARDVLQQLRSGRVALELLPQDRREDHSTHHSLSAVIAMMLGAASPLRQSPVVMRIGMQVELFVETFHPSPAADLRTLSWRSWSILDLDSLCESIRLGTAVTVASAPNFAKNSGPPLCSGSLGELVWALALYDPRAKLTPDLRPDQPFSLVRWPDIKGVPLRGTQLRFAALLARGSLSVQQLIERAMTTESEVVPFINACYWLGFLRPSGTSISAPSAPVATARFPSRLGGLLESIRAALRGAVVRDVR